MIALNRNNYKFDNCCFVMENLANLADEELLDLFLLEIRSDKRSLDEVPPSQFTFKDLTGKRIAQYKKIKNTLPYNPTVESPNPEFFQVLIFDDDSAILYEKWGDGESPHLNSYLYEKGNIKFSDCLFDAYLEP